MTKLTDVQKAFVILVRSVAREIHHGVSEQSYEVNNIRVFVSRQIIRLNAAIVAARTLGGLMGDVAKLSPSEGKALSRDLYHRRKVEMTEQQILERIVHELRERGVGEEVLGTILPEEAEVFDPAHPFVCGKTDSQ